MRHTVKSLLVIFFLLGTIAILGLVSSQDGLTGNLIGNTITCSTDQDCDDQITATADTCKNPGTEYALCVNKPKE